MMGWLVVGAAVIAAIRLNGTALFWPAVVVAVLGFWSLGIMWNTKGQSVRGSYERFVVTLNALATLAAVGLLLYSFVGATRPTR